MRLNFTKVLSICYPLSLSFYGWLPTTLKSHGDQMPCCTHENVSHCRSKKFKLSTAASKTWFVSWCNGHIHRNLNSFNLITADFSNRQRRGLCHAHSINKTVNEIELQIFHGRMSFPARLKEITMASVNQSTALFITKVCSPLKSCFSLCICSMLLQWEMGLYTQTWATVTPL